MTWLKAARPGDTITLPPGFYGDLNLTKPVRIVGPPSVVFNSVSVSAAASGAVLEGFSVRLTPSDTTADFSSVIKVTLAKDIVLKGLTVRSGRAPMTSTKAKYPGQLTSRGITLDRCENVKVEGCDIAECVDGIVPLKGSGLELVGNCIHDTRGSPISGAGTMGLTISRNHLRSVRPVNHGDTANDGDHADMIHLWTRGLSEPMRGVRIEGNVCEQGEGVGILGIFLQDNSGFGFEDVTIADNVVHLANRQGIAVGGIRSGAITGNRLTPAPGTLAGKEPTIILRDCGPLTIAGNALADSRDLAGYRENSFG